MSTTRTIGMGLAALVGVALSAAPALSDTGEALLTGSCAGCHQIAEPAAASLSDRMARKGPPLYYAGDKYRAEWLVSWLQDPTRIHPAGVFFAAHVKDTPDGEDIDAATLIDHPALSADDAQAVADALMGRSAKADLLAAEDYTPGSVSKRMGMLNFGKFKGCASCHSDEVGYGGVSGPELYTAFARLQPAYIVSYIRDPQAWEPFSLMPNQRLKDTDAHALANYLRVISEEQP